MNKFKVGDTIIRSRRKEPRKVLRIENDHYILSDNKNSFGWMWWNRYTVESQFKILKEQDEN